MKFCVFVIFILCPWIIRVGNWALKWTEGNETLQIFFVMLFFPVIMNALQYYIIDGFIKDQKPDDHEPIPSEDDEESEDEDDGRPRRQRSRRSHEGPDGAYDSDEDDLAKSRGGVKATEVSDKEVTDGAPKLRSDPSKMDEYDPAMDGELGSSSGSSTIRNGPAKPINGSSEETRKP